MFTIKKSLENILPLKKNSESIKYANIDTTVKLYSVCQCSYKYLGDGYAFKMII